MRFDASLESPGAEPDFRFTFSRVQSLQHQRELIHDATLVLCYQCEIIRELKMLILQNSSQVQVQKDNQYLVHMNRQLEELASQFTMKKRWAKDILQRAKQAAQLVGHSCRDSTCSNTPLTSSHRSQRSSILGILRL